MPKATVDTATMTCNPASVPIGGSNLTMTITLEVDHDVLSQASYLVAARGLAKNTGASSYIPADRISGRSLRTKAFKVVGQIVEKVDINIYSNATGTPVLVYISTNHPLDIN
jgi:hypothetical protein